jgi:hypothetical protein
VQSFNPAPYYTLPFLARLQQKNGIVNDLAGGIIWHFHFSFYLTIRGKKIFPIFVFL